jgi:cytidylate kinase
MVADRLGLRLVNYTFRALAAERGMSFEEVRRQAEHDTSLDVYLDKRQVELARNGDCVLGSRLAVWLLEDADLKVYLTAPLSVRAARIQRREGGSFQEVLRKTRARDERDRNRYLQLYGIDNNDFEFVDLVIDTQHIQPEEVAERIVSAVRSPRGV